MHFSQHKKTDKTNFPRDKLKQMIEACKALHENFDEKRRDVRAEKQKKIRELTDPNHAWGAGFDGPAAAGVAEPEPVPAVVEVIVPAAAALTAAAITELAAPGYLQYQVWHNFNIIGSILENLNATHPNATKIFFRVSE